jgi:molecular chaperone HtpG
LKAALRNARPGQHLLELIQDILCVRRVSSDDQGGRFFEVELNGVIRHRNDRLLSAAAVRDYLAQVAPLPFSPDFKFGSEISAALKAYVKLGDLDIRIKGTEGPIYRPHQNAIEVGDRNFDKVTELEVKELAGIDGGIAAVAWVLHHGYHGALPAKTLIKGIRLRTGNVQVGDNALLEDMFPEPRFNGWAVGEVHVIDSKVLPNGRRDHFEQSAHFDNLLNQLTPIVREIAKHCRDSSIGRKWLREFEMHKSAALEKARTVSRGGISKMTRRSYIDAVAKSIKAMRKVVGTRHIGEDTRATLTAEAGAVEARLQKLLGEKAEATDPLARFKPATRTAYQQIIALIYECASTDAAGSVLVEKILNRLANQSDPSTKGKAANKATSGRHR